MSINTTDPTDPYDPMCERFARDMDDYDNFILEEDEERLVSVQERIDYVHNEEGTYNPTNGHFLCDMCYIKAGSPSSSTGWKCP